MPALRAIALVLALSNASCSLVAATRAPTPEQGEAACSNFLDDDLDGTLDCEDVECDGVCAEETLDACTDGRDNDGDGVTDAVDARCWHVVPPTVKRCATIQGSRVEPPIDESALVWRGVADVVPDPRDAAASVFAARGPVFRIAPVASSTGALDGLRLTATLRVVRSVETTIALVPAGELGDATTAAVFTRYVRLVLGETVHLDTDRARGEVQVLAPSDLATPTWADVELEIVGRTVTASLSLGSGSAIRLTTIDLPSGFADPIALDVLVQAESDATAAVPMLASLSIERPSLPNCGRDELVPEMRADGADLILGAALGGPSGQTRCAISMENGAGRSYVAEGDADLSASPSTVAGSGMIGVALAWDPVRSAFVGVAAHGTDFARGTHPSSFEWIESADCVSWATTPLELPAIDPGLELSARGASYVVDDDGRHVLRFLANRAADVGILALESLDGAPESFVVVDRVREVGPDAQALVVNGAAPGIERIGTVDLVLLMTTDRGLVALTPRGSTGRFAELPEVLLGVSDVAGTFDRGVMIGPPRLLPSADLQTGRIFYGGTSFGNCLACLTSGSALFTVGTDP